MQLSPAAWFGCSLTSSARRLPAQEGSWDDVSGENFLRKLLSMPIEETRWDFYGEVHLGECMPACCIAAMSWLRIRMLPTAPPHGIEWVQAATKCLPSRRRSEWTPAT
jgi:hypothetical protein